MAGSLCSIVDDVFQAVGFECAVEPDGQGFGIGGVDAPVDGFGECAETFLEQLSQKTGFAARFAVCFALTEKTFGKAADGGGFGGVVLLVDHAFDLAQVGV
ncbi:hypothetical protein [Rhabdochromatium marinum]|uniref:hypothetical protein n=1 Tax=Rhabdochromatium marinum TaxID=48729 RepID=UPI001906E0B6|nr:hypothetical protein [Rhabdochromatium marinum]MBK1649787.1 hypothetical protein [Rhabdochromatium marinum]